MHKIVVNGVEIFPFSSEAQLLNYVNERKGILIAIISFIFSRASSIWTSETVVSMFFSSQRCFLSMSIKSFTCGSAAASLWQKI